jgi:hypothetical protein
VATEENRMPDELRPEPRDDFAADFRDGEAMAREWIAGRGDLPDLLHIVRDMPRGGELGGLEAGFVSTIDAAVRGDRLGAANVPDPATAQQLLEATPASASPEAVSTPVDLVAFHRRRRQHELAARLDQLGHRNAEAFVGLQHAFAPGNQTRNDADWRGW